MGVMWSGNTIAQAVPTSPRMSEPTHLNQSQQEFCASLKAARERRGLKLTDIAAATKICPSYFSALERNDLRVCPKGLFRRSFFRAYAGAVGLPEAETLAEFLRLFPDEEPVAAPAPPPPAKPGWRRIFETVQAFFGAVDDAGTPKPVATDQSWSSDAKRVRPRNQSPRVRIRIKVTP
jgi:transcriptional regulator with XRE-family HTH domain